MHIAKSFLENFSWKKFPLFANKEVKADTVPLQVGWIKIGLGPFKAPWLPMDASYPLQFALRIVIDLFEGRFHGIFTAEVEAWTKILPSSSLVMKFLAWSNGNISDMTFLESLLFSLQGKLDLGFGFLQHEVPPSLMLRQQENPPETLGQWLYWCEYKITMNITKFLYSGKILGVWRKNLY